MKRTFLSVIILLGLCGFLPAQYIQTVGEPADTLKQGHVQIDSTLKFRGNDLTSFLQLVDANGQVLDAGIKSAATWNTAYSHSTSSHPYGNVGTKSVNESSIANGKVLKYNSASGNVEYADDAGTTYTASELGIKLSGNQFSLSLDGSTLSQSASGVKVADNTFAAYSHGHSGVYEPAITTLGIAKGGTNNTSYTSNKFLAYDGTKFSSTSYDQNSFAASGHAHTGTYEPVISTLGIAKGGTNATSYTASQLLRVNSAGTAFESAGVTTSSLATASALSTHTGDTGNPHGVTATQVLPSQTGNSGKYLATNGTTASWADVPTGEGADGNNYPTYIGVTGTSTKTIVLRRSGLDSLTAAFSFNTDQVSEGTTNKYYTDARARGAISSSATGLTYTSSTGAFSLTTGYSIPTTANQTNWGTAYTDRFKWDGGSAGLDTAAARVSLGFGGAARMGVGTTAGTVAAGDHAHSGTYEPVISTLGIAKGGTNATSYTSGQLLRMNAGGTAFESAGVTTASFATSSHNHSGQTINPDTVLAKSVTVNGYYSLPDSAGVAGQFLAHDGTWAVPGGVNMKAQALGLNANVLTIDADQDILESYSTIRFGSPRAVHELAYMGGVTGTGSGKLLDAAHDVAFTDDNYLMVSSRGTDNAVTAWPLTRSRYTTQQSVIRGAGSPYYMDDGVVVRAHPTKSWVAYAAYADSAIVVIDVSESKSPRLLGYARGAAGHGGLYLNAPHSVEWYGDWLVSANGGDASITVFDCSNPDSSSFMTSLGHIRGAHGTNGLYLYAVSDLAIKSIGDSIYVFAVSRQDGNRTTPADENTAGCLQVFNITDPSNIKLVGGAYSDEAPYETVGSYEIEGATGITIDSNNRVYISTRWQNRAIQSYDSGLAVGSLTIFDVSDPTDPSFLGCIKGRGTGATSGAYPNGVYLGEAHWVQKHGNYCAVSAFTDDCVTLFDVSNPASPTQVSHVGTSGDYCNGPVGNVFSPDGKLLYVAAYWSAAFLVYDVETPASPVRIGGKTGTGYPYYLDGAHGVAVSQDGDFVYVSSRKSDDAMSIWSSEDGLSLASTYDGSYTNAGMLDPVRITTSGDYCYVAARTSDRILKLNISNKASITNVGSISGAGSPNYLDSPNSVVKSGNYLYVAAGGDNSLVILNDVAGNNSPTLAGVYTHATYASAVNGVAVNAAGTRAYLAALGSNTITVLDITSKSSPTYINSVSGAGAPYYLNIIRDVVLVGNYLYGVSSNDDVVVVYDVSGVDGSNAPRLVATYSGAGSPNYADRAYGLAASGDSALYVASFNDNAILELRIDGEDIARENVISGAASLLTGASNVDVGTAYGKNYIAVASYTEDAFAIFKTSEITTLNEVGIRSNFGVIEYKNASDAAWSAISSSSGGILGVTVSAPLTGGGTSGTVTVGVDTTEDAAALATKGWVQRQGYSTSGASLVLSANGGLQILNDSLGTKLNGGTLTKSSLGLKVTDDTFAAYSHGHSGVYEPVITTLGISKGGTNNTSYTSNKFLAYDGTKFASTSYDQNSFAASEHVHTGVYEPAITTLGIAKGGTNATSYTASQLLRMNSAGTAFESAGVTTASFATSSHVHTGVYEPAITTLGVAKGGTNATSYTASQLLRMNAAGTAFESAGVTTSSFASASHSHSISDLSSMSSADLADKLSDETGSGGGFVRATSPTITGATLSVANKTNVPGQNKHLRFTLIAPNAAVTAVGSPYNICIWPKTDAAITITGIDVTCNADPTAELDGNLKKADAFIGLANAATLGAFDTTSGAYSGSSLAYQVASGKCVYISFDAVPESALKSISFDVTYDYD